MKSCKLLLGLASIATGLLLVGGCDDGGSGGTTAGFPVVAGQNDNLIVPGARVGRVALGMTETEIYNAFGDPAETKFTSYGARIHYYYPSMGLDVGVDKSSHRVVAIGVMDSRYSTAEGVHKGSSGLELQAKLGSNRGPCDLNLGCMFNYEGLVVSVAGNRTVEWMSVVQRGYGAY